MSIRSYIYMSFFWTVLFGSLLSCADEEDLMRNKDAQEIVISTAIPGGSNETRAVAIVADYVGRGIVVENSSDKDLESGDKIRLTLIKRTDQPLTKFTYTDVDFLNTAGSWDRTSDTDHRVYWSDAEHAHTFIGYSLPNDAFASKWIEKKSGDGTLSTFYSCIGDPLKSNTQEIIDFSSVFDTDGNETISGNTKIKAEDLLLTHDTKKTAETGGSVAKLYFHHALANVRVIVDIRGFAATSDALDTHTRVSDLVLKNMPMMYKWKQMSFEAEPLTTVDASKLPTGWSNDLKKDIKTWMPHPEGVGETVERTFTFYALAVPGSTDLVMPFKVTYPKPLNPTELITKDYEATINNVVLKAGFCTTINISLNHSNEDMTVGATYIDWEFIESPDQGTLRKNSVFLDNTDRSKITIVGDALATADDAIWLYNELKADGTPKTDANGKQIIKDIYGHTGDTEADAYQISTAQQLLSFAYEVSGTGRAKENGSTLEGAMDFTGKYVKLDADIYLQAKRTSDNLDWIGIGDADHPFNGIFIGGGRIISRMKGSSLFVSLGANAVVDLLTIQDVLSVGSHSGALADVNNGKIIGCNIEGNVTSTSSNLIGAIVGTNNGTIETCYHIGDIQGAGAVAGLVGQNAGSMTACYNAGAISTTGSNSTYGVTSLTISGGTATNCYYNEKLAGNGVTGENGKNTSEMQKQYFVQELNSALDNTSKYSYVYNPTQYPSLAPYQEDNSDLSDGFYRVKNFGTGRYVYVTDNKGHYHSSTNQDLGAIVLRKELSNAISDPASIIYVKKIAASGEYDLISQGVSIHTITTHYAVINPTRGHYRVGAQETFNTYLVDGTNTNDVDGNVSTQNNGDVNTLLWDAVPVNSSSSDNYFGITPNPSILCNSKYYASFYAGFGFETASKGMEVFYISDLNETEGKVCMKKITGTVPAGTPVIVACSSTSASENRLSLKNNNSLFAYVNYLKGNMFNNAIRNNQTAYDPATMRVLDVTRDGKLAYVKKTTDQLAYLPANTSYLVVSDCAPDIIYVETEDVYYDQASSGFPMSEGYYRIQNLGSKRYLSVTDSEASISIDDVNITYDLDALALNKTLNYSDPGSVVYVTAGGDIISQGVSLKSKISDFTVNMRKGSDNNDHYRVGAERSGLSRYICDVTTADDEAGKVDTYVGANKDYLLWDAFPINETNYFGLTPSVNNGSTYYAPFYADFDFTVSAGMKVYYISQLNESEGKVCMEEITSTVPAKTPVFILCTSADASNNKLSLQKNTATFALKNYLKGNMFNNAGRHNQKQYDPATMRVLEFTSDGKLSYVKKTLEQLANLPANSSYLVVSAGAPDIIYVESKEDYNNGQSGTNTNPITTGYYHVKNVGSQRYLSVIDDQVTINVNDVNITHDLGALALKTELIASDPGAIIYVTSDGDITCQGVSLRSKIPGFTVNERTDSDGNNHYRVGAERSGLSRYICDAVTSSEATGKVDTHVGTDKKYLLWDVVAANDFVLSPTISVDSKNYVPFYAEFGFEISSGIDVYYVDHIDASNAEGPKVILKKLSGTIPNKTPVIIAYTGSGRITPKFENGTLSVTNLLSGNMFNTVPNSEGKHENRKQVTENMRILGVDSEGKLVFKKAADTTYLPANSSYLQGDNLPDTLTVEIETQP